MSAKHKLLKTNPYGSRRAIVETLEPRLLMSAGLEAFVINNDSVQGEALLQPATEAELIPQSDANQTQVELIQRQELVFVDTDTPDYQLLLDDLLNNQTDDRQFEVILLDNEQSGIDQISEALASRGDLDAIHIISHGADGTVDLGNTQLAFETLLSNANQIANWGQALTADGDLLLYGCDLAATTNGQSLVNALAQLTGADVAASDDLTGNPQEGGDWELEYQTGQVETKVAVSEIMQQQWQGTLAIPTAAADSYNVDEDTTLNVAAPGVLSNDSGSSLVVLDATQPTNGTVVMNADGSFNYTPDPNFNGTDTFTYLVAETADGTTHYWNLDGTATDSVGTADGSINGTTTVAGPYGNALSFDEVNDYIEAPDISYNNEFTISFKFKIDDNSGNTFQYLYSHGDPSFANSINIYTTESGWYGGPTSLPDQLRTRVVDSNDAVTWMDIDIGNSGLDLIGDGQWHEYTLTVSSTDGTQVYIDGVLQGSLATNGGDAINPSGNLIIGGRQDLDPNRFYGGELQHVQIYDRALTASEVTDQHNNIARETVTITVNPINDAPVLDLDADNSSGTSGNNFTTAFYDGGAAVNITDSDVLLSDIDSTTLSSVTIVLTNPLDGTNKETLSANAGSTGLSVNWVAATSTLTITGTASLADYQSVLSTVTYENIQNNPNTTDRNITFVADDGTDTSLVSTTTVKVFQVGGGNNVPVAQSNTVTTLEDNPYTFSSTDFTYVDVDGDALVSATITNLALAGGVLTYNGGTAVTNNTTLTAAELDTLVYTPAVDANGTPLATFDFTVNDAGQGVTSATMSIDVTPVNDVPTGTVTINGTPTEDQILTADVSGISDADGLGTFSYQWQRDGVNIFGATTAIYTLGDADVGTNITVVASYTDLEGTTESLTSASVGPIANINDVPVANNDSYSIDENQTLYVTSVLTNKDTAANLEALWQFDEGTGSTTADGTGNGNDGTLIGDTSWTTSSRTGTGALTFDGTGDYIQTTEDLSTATNFTISAWFQTDTTTGVQHLVWQGVSTQNGWGEPTPGDLNNSEMNLSVGRYDADNKITFFLGYHDLSAASIDITSASDFTDTSGWHHAVVVVQETGTPGELEAFLYVDGVLEGSDTGTEIDRSLWDSNLRIGRAGADQRYFDGTIDEVGIYNRALDSTEIADLYTAGVLVNDTDADGDILTVNTTPVTDVSNGTLALNADGSFTYTPNANFSGTDSFTYEVSDGNGGTSQATVTITVNPVNVAPVANNDSYTVDEGSTTTLDLAANDTDADDGLDLASIAIVSGPSNGSIVVNADGTVDYTHDGSETLADSFTYTIDDLSGATSNTVTVSLTINPVDDPAVIGGQISYTGNEGDAVGGTMTATDVDGLTDGTYFSVTTGASNGTAAIDPATGAWTFIPTDPNWFGSDNFTVTVTDDLGGTTTQVVSISLVNVDDPAVIGGQISYTGNEGDAVGGTMTATDVDGLTDGTYFSVTTGASNGTAAIDPATGAWTFIPTDPNWFGSDNFTVTVTDDLGGTTTQVVSISLANVNDAPVANNDSYSTNEDTALTAVLGVNDLLQNDSDVDGDSLSVNTTPVTDVTNGTLTLNADGTFTYTPNANFNGTDSFTYEVSDGNGGTATASVNITVNAINDAPVAADATINATEDVVYNGTLPAASDADGDPITYALGTAATNGTAVVNADGSFSYTPNANYNGADSFTYTVDDGNGGSNTYTVTVNVALVNDAPVANDDVFTVNEGSTSTLDLAFNDIDVDDGLDLTSITIVSGPTNGSITVNADGTVDYTHDGSETLADSFIYTIDDLSGTTSNTGFVSLTITPINDAPVAGNDSLTTIQGTALTITPATNLLGNDTDAEGDPLNITGFTQPANGTVVNNADGTWTYTPNPTFSGVDSFTYTVDDGNGGTATATLNVTVGAIVGATGNTLVETQSSNDTMISMAVNSTSNDDQTVQQTVKRYDQQDAYETTTARDPSALLSVLNPVHVMSQIDVIDEVSNIYRTIRSMNSDAQSGMGNGLLNNEMLWQELDQLRSTINGSNDEDGIFKGSFSDVIISLGGLSVTSGLIAWLLRGGSLAASFISAMPLWKGMDPLPVLNKNKKDEEEEDDDATEISADKRVERLIEGDSSHW